jgi:hypothetical protein
LRGGHLFCLAYSYQRSAKRYGGDGLIRIEGNEAAMVGQIFECMQSW